MSSLKTWAVQLKLGSGSWSPQVQPGAGAVEVPAELSSAAGTTGGGLGLHAQVNHVLNCNHHCFGNVFMPLHGAATFQATLLIYTGG